MSTESNTPVQRKGRYKCTTKGKTPDQSWRQRREAEGLAHGKAQLTPGQVQELRVRWMLGEQQKKLAQRSGLCQTTISKIIRGQTWGWLPWPKVDRETFVRQVLGVGAKAAQKGRERLEGAA
jgi:hypothetical protein